MEELQNEKDKIEAEKLENAKMLEELKALKAQLEEQKSEKADDELATGSAEKEIPV